MQDLIAAAQYWHDPLTEEEYLQNSLFLADINNQGPVKNTSYRENLASLQNLVLVKFNQDTIVDPRESEWFGWFSSADDDTMLPMKVKLDQSEWIKDFPV